MKFNNEYFTKEEISLILESISNIFYVMPTNKSADLLKNNNEIVDNLINDLLIIKKEESPYIDKKYLPLIKNVLEISLNIFSDDELQTYTGQNRHFIQAFVHRISSGS